MAENETIKERLITFIKYLHIGQAKFEANCGLSNGYVNNIRRSVTPEKLQQITLRYPELNPGWLMTGEGDMIKPGTVVQHVSGGENNFTGTGNMEVVNPPCIQEMSIIFKEVSEQRRLVERQMEINAQQIAKKDEQIDRLIAIIEKLQTV